MIRQYKISDLSSRFGSCYKETLIPSLSSVTNALNDTIKGFSVSCLVVSSLNDVGTKISPLSDLNEGTIVIVSSLIDGVHENRKTYAWKKDNSIEDISGTWQAFDNDFDAGNVYFSDNIDLIGTYDRVGNIKINDKTLSCKGKSVYQVVKEIFRTNVKPELGEIPYGKIKINKSQSVEVGTYLENVVLSGYFYEGKYNLPWLKDESGNISTINDQTSALTWTMTFNGNTYTIDTKDIHTGLTSYSIPGFYVKESTEYSKLTIGYSCGISVEDSDGVPSLQRGSGATKQSSSSEYIKGYRNMFIGSFESKDLSVQLSSSEFIRNNYKNVQMTTGVIYIGNADNPPAAYKYTIPENKKAVFIAIPSSYSITEVRGADGFLTNYDIIKRINITGANNQNSTEYKIYLNSQGDYYSNMYHKITIK